ncbi:MAG: S-layer homology domain-containing protein [Synergistaceae bacterium]|nr:S-layer homology domain-containing protein [Synergistaceae bacterium]
MKKFAVLTAIVAIAALAAPAFSATNPFMDVPMNHWAYDAIGQLAAHGILSGYPDGLYKGKQQTTRYEMASALARALAVVDMTKASKQDVEMLKRLVVEFKDELEALGVRVDELDERVAVLENRLGGWHIHGSLVLDVKNRSAENALSGKGDGQINFDNARLYFERTFGENDEYFFRARLRNDGDANDGFTNNSSNSAYFDRYYVEMPFFMDTRLTVGRFLFDVDTAYRPSIAETGSWTGGDSVLTDTSEIGFALQKNFGLGSFLAYVSHSNRLPDSGRFPAYNGGLWEAGTSNFGVNRKAWTLFAMANLQFTESVGLDLGGQAFIGDNASTAPTILNSTGTELLNGVGDRNFKNLWTIFAGLRFNFNDAIAIKGAFYHQKISAEQVQYDSTGTQLAWRDYGYGFLNTAGNFVDDANHWRAIIDVKQDALKFTSLWLEYGHYDMGFFTPQGISTIFPSESTVLTSNFAAGASTMYDLSYWRVVLGQQWTDQWATHIFYYGYKADDTYVNAAGNWENSKPYELGVGVQYKLNDATTMGLNYVHVDSDLPSNALRDNTKDNVIRFRTSVNF